MASETPSIIETRRAQMFPTLNASEIERLRRFGTQHSYPAGAYLSKAGEVSPGMFVILSGEVEVTQRDPLGHEAPIVSYGPGSFMAELAVLSGNPALVDGVAQSPVEAIVIPTPKLRQLMVEEAELGERIMRAMILRRMALLESGLAGPILIGRSMDALVLRLENYLTRNGHPHHRLDPDTDDCAKTLIEKFHVGAEDLPIVLCPNGQLLRKPDEHELAQCLGLIKPVDFAKLYDLAIVGAGPAGLAAAVYG
ncbi:MAG TPA: cyclic nucleotide-binding domain-containing protein, partial [Rhizomicrobium sp.]